VEPEWTTYDGDDPVAFILSANVARRHLSKGQAAMAVARALLVSDTRQVDAARSVGASQARVSQANVVLTHAPDLADGVLLGALGLDAAYETARERKEAAQSDEGKLLRLQREAPNLAALVTEERLTLAGSLPKRRVPARRGRRRPPRRVGGWASPQPAPAG
jgi:hypothetical protein